MNARRFFHRLKVKNKICPATPLTAGPPQRGKAGCDACPHLSPPHGAGVVVCASVTKPAAAGAGSFSQPTESPAAKILSRGNPVRAGGEWETRKSF